MAFDLGHTSFRYFDNIRVNQRAEVPEWKINFWNVVWKYTSPTLMVVILFSSTVLLILKPLLYDVYIDVSGYLYADTFYVVGTVDRLWSHCA